MQKWQRDGLIRDSIDRVFVGEEEDKHFSAIALVRVDEKSVIMGKARCRSYDFPAMPTWQLCDELAVVDLGENVQSFSRGEYQPISMEQAKIEMQRYEHLRQKKKFVTSNGAVW